MKKIAIVTENDTLWSLTTWEQTIPQLKELNGYEVVGLWTCDAKFANIHNNKINQWYVKTFGLFNFFKLGLFFVFQKLRKFFLGASRSFSHLAKQSNIYFNTTRSPNDQKFIMWLKEEKIDILIIMVGHIIKKELINSVDMIVNKHASLLPLNKGMFPYFWAKLYDTPLGVTFHLVDEGIDTGKIIYQKEIVDKYHSMIDYYIDIFNNYPDELKQTLINLSENKKTSIKKELESSYYGLPSKDSVKKFLQLGNNIITIKDILYFRKLKCKIK